MRLRTLIARSYPFVKSAAACQGVPCRCPTQLLSPHECDMISELIKTYHNALAALYDANRSTSQYLIHDELKIPRTLLGQEIQYLNGQSVNKLISENQKTSLGDYWRVLRVRPPTNKFNAEKPQLEYIPNNTYTYYEVKTTLENVKRLKVKPTRYWNELPIKDVQSDILYSLSDYYPGLPYEANIIRDNESLGLPIYRIRELVFFQDQHRQWRAMCPTRTNLVKRLMLKQPSAT